MKVQEAMAKTVSSASPQDTVGTVAKLMKKEDAGFIPVVDGDRLVGVVTDRDIVIRCLAEGHSNCLEERVEHVMSSNVQTVSPQDDLDRAASLMESSEVRRLAVVENGRLVGVLSHGNLVQATSGKGAAEKATAGVTRGA